MENETLGCGDDSTNICIHSVSTAVPSTSCQPTSMPTHWLERVVGRESNVEEENAAREGRVTRSHDGRLPLEHVVSRRTSRARRRRVTTEVGKLLYKSSRKQERE